MEVQGSFQPRSTHGLNPASELPSSNRLSSRVTGSFSYCRLNIPRIPPLSARDENEIPSPLLQHALDAEREWEAVEVQRRRIIIQALAFSPSLQECLTASVLSDEPPVSSGTTMRILKLRRTLGGKQACNQSLLSPNLFALLATCEARPSYPLETTLHTDRGDSIILSGKSVLVSLYQCNPQPVIAPSFPTTITRTTPFVHRLAKEILPVPYLYLQHRLFPVAAGKRLTFSSRLTGSAQLCGCPVFLFHRSSELLDNFFVYGP
ncbi:hypothetical protein K443DRAFT_656949, partial [Laccaria amethystina LaAM-08-1]